MLDASCSRWSESQSVEGRLWWKCQSDGVTSTDLELNRAEEDDQSGSGGSDIRDWKVFGSRKLVETDEGEQRSAWPTLWCMWRDDRDGCTSTRASMRTTMLREGKQCTCRKEAQRQETVVQLSNAQTAMVEDSCSGREEDRNRRNDAKCNGSKNEFDATKWMRYHGSEAALLKSNLVNVQTWQPQEEAQFKLA